MQQTERKTEPTRRAPKEEEATRQNKNRSLQREAAQALEAILSGGSWEQLPMEGVLALSHAAGNSALLELAALRDSGPEEAPSSLPEGPCETSPLEMSAGEPLLADAPVFSGPSSAGASAPLML